MLHSPVKTVCSCRPLPFSIPGWEPSGANPPQSRINPGFFKTFRTLPQQHLFNEWYARDISKKRRISNKIKGNSGEPMGQPPFGYMKDPDDPKHWIVDKDAAAVVRRVYSMTLEGYGTEQIAAKFEQENILTPTAYWLSKGVKRLGKGKE